MNPWPILATLLVWVASLVATSVYSISIGKDQEIAKQAAVTEAIDLTREAARQGAASEIAKIKVTNTTIQGKLRTVVENNPVYRDCKLDDAGLQLINQAISGKRSGSGFDSGNELPRTVSPIR